MGKRAGRRGLPGRHSFAHVEDQPLFTKKSRMSSAAEEELCLPTTLYGPEGVQRAKASRGGISAGIVMGPYLSMQIYPGSARAYPRSPTRLRHFCRHCPKTPAEGI